MAELPALLAFDLGGPSPSLPAAAYARMLTALLPPGRLWRLIGDSVLGKVLLAIADELARVDNRAHDLLRESDPTTAIELLPEYEAELGLVAAATIAERQANVVARNVTRQRVRPVDFRLALAPLLGQAAEDVVIIERTHAFAASIGDDREIFRFFVYRDPGLPGDYFVASAQALVDAMAPLHTQGHVIESVSFACDDPFSLCDRDLLGSAPSFVGASTAVTARSTTITLTTPDGVAPGDTLLLLAASTNTAQSDMTTGSLPAGWSLLSRIDTSPGVSVLARRVATVGEPASHVFPMTSTGSGAPLLGVIVAYRGLDPDAALVAASAVAAMATTSVVCPSLTLTAHRDLYLGWCGANNNTASAIPPAGTTERVDQGAAQSGFNRAVAFDFVPTASGATGTHTVTMSLAVTGVAAAYALRVQGVV